MFRWLRVYLERRDSREGIHYRDTPIYEKRGRQVIYPEEYTHKRTFTEDSSGFVSRRQDDKVWKGQTVEQVRPRWITGWLGIGRGHHHDPPRQEVPYEPWPGAGDSHGWVQDQQPPYRPWPGSDEDDRRGGR